MKEELVVFSILFFKRSVVEEFFNQVDVAEEHPAAAIPLEPKSVQSIAGKINGDDLMANGAGIDLPFRIFCL